MDNEKNTISLPVIDWMKASYPSYGAGNGTVIKDTYECPCGKGKVYYEKNNILGIRDREAYTDCKECQGKYEFSRGYAKKVWFVIE